MTQGEKIFWGPVAETPQHGIIVADKENILQAATNENNLKFVCNFWTVTASTNKRKSIRTDENDSTKDKKGFIQLNRISSGNKSTRKFLNRSVLGREDRGTCPPMPSSD